MPIAVELEVHKDETFLRLNSPPSNILDFEVMRQLSTALDEASNVPVLILSSGLENFSLGVDVRIHTPELSDAMLKHFHELIRKIYYHSGITISIINGYALGGGMELALACDFVFAQKKAMLGFPEIRLACFPPVASILLPRKIGGRACMFLYSGKLVEATAAEDMGMIEAVFTENPDELLDTIRQHSLSAMRLLKKVLRHTSGFDFDTELSKAEKIYLNELIRTPDMSEGVKAFLEKRPPHFKEH